MQNAFQSPISATSAVAPIGPMPGISASRRLASHARCRARMLLSMDPISAADRAVLPCQHIEDAADGWGNPAIRGIRDDPEQLCRSIAALGRHDAEFGQVPA